MDNLEISILENYLHFKNNYVIGGLKAAGATTNQLNPISIAFMQNDKIKNTLDPNIIFSKAEIEIAISFNDDYSITQALNELNKKNFEYYLAVELLSPILENNYCDIIRQNAGFAYCIILKKLKKEEINMNFSFYLGKTKISNSGNIDILENQSPIFVAKSMLEILYKINPNFILKKGFKIITGSLITPIDINSNMKLSIHINENFLCYLE